MVCASGTLPLHSAGAERPSSGQDRTFQLETPSAPQVYGGKRVDQFYSVMPYASICHYLHISHALIVSVDRIDLCCLLTGQQNLGAKGVLKAAEVAG